MLTILKTFQFLINIKLPQPMKLRQFHGKILLLMGDTMEDTKTLLTPTQSLQPFIQSKIMAIQASQHGCTRSAALDA
jgi:hypothetical protein